MLLRTSCDLKFDITVPTPFILMLRPRSGSNQWITSEEYKIVPSVPVTEFTDIYGNLCQRLIAPAGHFSIHTTAEVMTSDHVDEAPGAPFVEIQNLPEGVLTYLLPSRYCEADHFSQMATEITRDALLGYDQVSVITTWIRNNIRFESYFSDILVSATEVNERQSGVIQESSSLYILSSNGVNLKYTP